MSKDRKEYKREYYHLTKDKNKDKRKKYYKKNKKEIIEKTRKYYSDNRELVLEKKKEYSVNNSERIKNYSKEWRQENKDKIRKYIEEHKVGRMIYRNHRMKNDPLYRLTNSVRSLISSSIKRFGFSKKSKTSQILGCSFEEFKLHLEFKFETWMTWENYGLYNGELNYGWDIDHIIPISSAISEEDILVLCNFKNLQPLCSYVNRNIKTNKLDYLVV
jgi:hypothetical protein